MPRRRGLLSRRAAGRPASKPPVAEKAPRAGRASTAAPPQPPSPRSRLGSLRSWLPVVLIVAANYFLFSTIVPDRPQRTELPYTVFKQQVAAGNVVEVTSRGDLIQGTLKEPLTYPPDAGPSARASKQFATFRPEFAAPGLETLLEEQGVVINARPLEEPRSWWVNLLFSFGPTLLLIAGFLWLSRLAARQASGGLFGLGRSRAKRYDEAAAGEGRVTFADVAGIDEAKAELVEIVDFLKDPSKYTRLGGTAPKGVLLVGPPGTGKTLLARAVAGEADVPFFSMGASEFVEMIVGVGASRVRDLFREARKAAPAIIFIDELDAIGRSRSGAGVFAGHSEQEQTLNQILTEMDGFSSREGVIVVAATNRPDVLDQALLRPGRFDRRVIVQPPDRVGREAILRVHTHQVPLADTVDLAQVAAATPGLVGADLRNLVNEAALLAARRDQETVRQGDFLDALEKLTLGPARNLLLNAEERERVAYHEGGHTILGLLVPGADPVNRVTITPRGQALGVTYQRPQDERHNYDEPYLRARIVGALGGRVAEELVYGNHSSGAESDLEHATQLAHQMVTRWGMSDKLGPVTLAPRQDGFLGPAEAFGLGGAKPYSEATAALIDAEIRRILQECHHQAAQLVAQHRAELDTLAQALLDHETLDEQQILQVTGLPSAPRLATRPVPIASGVPEAAFGLRPTSLRNAGSADTDSTSGARSGSERS